MIQQMNRKVLIIGSPLKGKNHLGGVVFDTLNFYRYVQSSVGGVYDENEIQYAEHPSAILLKNHLSSLKNLDVLILYFSGHGFRSNNTDFICLNESEYFPVSHFLKIAAQRKLIFIDSCRTPIGRVQYGDVVQSEGYNFLNYRPDYSKRLYCQYLEQSPIGTVLAFSTSENKPALETENGGLFTTSMMKALKNWSELQNQEVITIEQAFKEAAIITKNSISDQIPKLYYQGNKSSLTIPFGINPMIHLDSKH